MVVGLSVWCVSACDGVCWPVPPDSLVAPVLVALASQAAVPLPHLQPLVPLVPPIPRVPPVPRVPLVRSLGRPSAGLQRGLAPSL